MSQTCSLLLLLVLVSVQSTYGGGVEQHFYHSNTNNEGEPSSPAYGTPELQLPIKEEWSHFRHNGNQLQLNKDKRVPEFAVPFHMNLFNMELFYRSDVVPCYHTYIPNSGKTRLYQTWVSYSKHYHKFRCWVKQIYTTSIQPNQPGGLSIYTIKSENYDNGYYYPRRLQYFNVTCPSTGIIQNMTMDLEERAKLTIGHDSINYCVDYVEISYKNSLGLCELCANETVKSQGCEQSFEEGINIMFRSSQFNNFGGFEMNVICFDVNEQNLPGCIQTRPAHQEKSMTSEVDRYYYHSTSQKFLPENTEKKLMNFYTNNVNAAQTFSAKENNDILRLAVLSENSCNAVLRVVGRQVVKMFPPVMVMNTRINVLGWEYV